MNEFTLPTKFLKTIKCLIDHYLAIQTIEFVVDQDRIEFILIKANTLTLRWKIEKVSMKNFNVKQRIASTIELKNFPNIFNKNDLKYLFFKQGNQQIEILDKKNSLWKFNTNLEPQKAINIPQNQVEIFQIDLAYITFQKIISEYQFSTHDIQIQIEQNQIKFLKDHKEIMKFKYQSTAQGQKLQLCKTAFSVMDTIIQTERIMNQVHLTLYQNQIQQLYFENDFNQVNILSHTKCIESTRFSSFIMKNGKQFLKVLQRFYSLISHTLVFSITQDSFKINQMDNTFASMIYFEIEKASLSSFKFEQEISESFEITPILEKFKTTQKICLQIKINSSTLIVIDEETNNIVELLKINDSEKFVPINTPPAQTIIQVKISSLLPLLEKQLPKSQILMICVLKEKAIIKHGDIDFVQSIKIISHDKQERNLYINSKYLKLFLGLIKKKSGVIQFNLVENQPIIIKHKICNFCNLSMHLSPIVEE